MGMVTVPGCGGGSDRDNNGLCFPPGTHHHLITDAISQALQREAQIAIEKAEKLEREARALRDRAVHLLRSLP